MQPDRSGHRLSQASSKPPFLALGLRRQFSSACAAGFEDRRFSHESWLWPSFYAAGKSISIVVAMLKKRIGYEQRQTGRFR
jgi:hypothetical protein